MTKLDQSPAPTTADEPAVRSELPVGQESSVDQAAAVDEGPPATRRRRRGQVARDRRVLLRLSEDEYRALAKAAEGSGLTATGFAAEAALAAAGKRETGPARLALVELMQSRTQLRKVGVNLNQAVAELHTTAQVPAWLARVVERVDAAVDRTDAATAAVAEILLGGRR